MGRVRAITFVFGFVGLIVLLVGVVLGATAGALMSYVPGGGGNVGLTVGLLIVAVAVVVGPFFFWAVLKTLTEIHEDLALIVDALTEPQGEAESPPPRRRHPTRPTAAS